jgi:hypothetical protein
MNQTIPVEAIKAALLFVARDKGRYAFNGLLLEHGRLTATDGRRLIEATWTPNEGDVAPGKDFILPREALEAASKVKACARVVVNGSLQTVCRGKRDPVDSMGPSFPYEPVEEEFPDVSAVIAQDRHRMLAAEPVCINPDFLSDVGRAAALVMGDMEAQKVKLELTGKATAARFEATGERVTLRGLVMPITG